MKLSWKKAATLGVGTAWLMASVITGEECPFLRQKEEEQKIRNLESSMRALNKRGGEGGVPKGGFAAVQEDIAKLLTDSQEFWPADFGNYGGLFIRLAWHCSGTYRKTDGRGGCDGGRVRFPPEISWMDNGNLDKGIELLRPIKEKYGSSLSWADLIVLSGTTAIESMGGPSSGFCGGRVDEADGSNSFILGPSAEQEAIAPCLTLEPSQQGLCNKVEGSPIGPTTIGLIYVDPEGPIDGRDDPVASGVDIRRTFAIMGFNDTESVALIGGGHAFGKCHGACENPPCGDGKGPNTFTSGLEGKWTETPTVWTNDYFYNMFNFEWELIKGPGGHMQWSPYTTDGSTPPDTIMLTADLALRDDNKYKSISKTYLKDIAALEKDFAAAWYKLTSADMGPSNRCIGDLVPPPQDFQHTLPEATGPTPDFASVRSKIQALLDEDDSNYDAFVNLAYQCASTFRKTDYRGGCNGARIRFAPESEWKSNDGTAAALRKLKPVKMAYPSASYADIIVLAGQTAIESAGGNEQPFCGGRVDAGDGKASEDLAPRVYEPPVVSIRDDMQVKGLSVREAVALAGRPTGPEFSNQFYKDLLAGEGEFSADELALLEEEFRPWVEKYARSEKTFQKEFAKAWAKMMTADRYDGPFKNACEGASTCTIEPCDKPTDPSMGKIMDAVCRFLECLDDLLDKFGPTFGNPALDKRASMSRAKANNAKQVMKESGRAFASVERVMQAMKWIESLASEGMYLGKEDAVAFANDIGDAGSKCTAAFVEDVIAAINDPFPKEEATMKLEEAKAANKEGKWKLSTRRSMQSIRMILNDFGSWTLPVCTK